MLTLTHQIPRLAADPASPAHGQSWYNTTTGTFKFCQGGVVSVLGGGSSAWGGITGTLSAQTDLQAALDGKQAAAAVLTATTAAFTTAQETKLAGVATGATANAPDAALRDRATHTGTQAASTITGLAAVATSGTFASLTATPTTLAGYGISGAGLMVTGGAGTWARLFGATAASNSIYGAAIILTPFYLPAPLTLDQLGCEITTAGASGVVGDLCIYDSDPAKSRPRNLLAATAAFAADVPGAKTAAISGGAVAIPQGVIWLGIRVSGQCSWRQAQNLAVIGGDAAPIVAPTTLASLVRYITWGSAPPSTWTYSASERHLIAAHVFWGRQA
jgi:hypothetical protein